ncbi:MAG: aldo/keto reductase [Sedimentisphaeraceae bacterium JB056]
MIYKEYGNTGHKVSAVGFGGMRFDLSIGQEKNADIIQYAYDNGINFLDTAPGYCEDQSEDIFGIFVDRNKSKREDFYVCTKCMPFRAPTKQEAIEAVEKSLRRLKTDYIDFFYTWCIRKRGHYEEAIVDGGFYEGLLECKERGMIKHLTISSHLQGNELKGILDEGRFEGVLLGVNVLNFPFRWQAVQSAYDSGYGVVAMNPLAGGAIPQNEVNLGFLTEKEETPTEAALRFCVSCPQITVTLNGFTTTDHIDTACKAADNASPFTAQEIDRIKNSVSQNMDSLCTGCGYCLKECPKHIPIARYLQMYNEKLFENKDEEAMLKAMEHHYNWGILVDRHADAKDCIKCHRCEDACTQHLNIMERLDEIAELQKKWEAEKEK